MKVGEIKGGMGNDGRESLENEGREVDEVRGGKAGVVWGGGSRDNKGK